MQGGRGPGDVDNDRSIEAKDRHHLLLGFAIHWYVIAPQVRPKFIVTSSAGGQNRKKETVLLFCWYGMVPPYHTTMAAAFCCIEHKKWLASISRPIQGWSQLDHNRRSLTSCRHRLPTVSLTMTASTTSTNIDSVLSNTDIAVGIILALLLAAVVSFLQSQRAQSDFVLGPLSDDQTKHNQSSPSNNATTNTTTTLFGDWSEISKRDNYIWYNTLLRDSKTKRHNTSQPTEQRWILVALIVLFAPIFSFEFFLTVSRQIICALSQDWCLPYNAD